LGKALVHTLTENNLFNFQRLIVTNFILYETQVNELRVMLTDSSFMDIWFSLKLQDRYSFHWERRAIDGTIYRHDNAPHRRWQAVSSHANAACWAGTPAGQYR